LLYIKSEATYKTSDKAVEEGNAITEEPPVTPQKQVVNRVWQMGQTGMSLNNTQKLWLHPTCNRRSQMVGPIDRWKKQQYLSIHWWYD